MDNLVAEASDVMLLWPAGCILGTTWGSLYSYPREASRAYWVTGHERAHS